jgi:AraC-like DNA-binding protein
MSHRRPTGRELREYLEKLSLPLREERIHFVRSSDLPSVELMVASDSAYPWYVYHERYAICACRTASAEWSYRGRRYFSGDRSNMLLEPGEVHFNTGMYKHCEFRVLFVEPCALIAAGEELGMRAVPHFRLALSEERPLFTAVEDLCVAMEDSTSPLEQQSTLTTCLHQVLSLAEQAAAPLHVRRARHPIERAKRHLQERFNEKVTLDDLVAVTRLSRFHLVREFTRLVGVPPHRYQTLVRVQRATTLLRSGRAPHIVAADVGFSDQSHLTRQFSRYWGVTPGEYARR